MKRDRQPKTGEDRNGANDSKLGIILVTGGCGFMGTNLVKYLSMSDCKVRILDNQSSGSYVWSDKRGLKTDELRRAQSNRDQELLEIDLIVGDIRDPMVVEEAVQGVDAVIHLAARTDVTESLEKPEETWDVNVSGTLNLLEACRRNGVDKLIFVSSNAAVGEQPPPINEMTTPRPISPYGASKLAGEALCLAYYHSFGLKTITLRFANCYGPYSKHKPSAIVEFIKWAKQGHPLIIYGDGMQTRDFIHADDICQAIHLVLSLQQGTSSTRLTHASGLWGKVFQIGTGTETSINQLAELVQEIATASYIGSENSKVGVIYQPERMGEIKRNYCDIGKAREILGFEPRVELREGLKALWRSF